LWVVEAEERNSVARKAKMPVCASVAPRFVRWAGAADPTNPVPPRRATGIFSSFELCDSFNCTHNFTPSPFPSNNQSWLEEVA
jgi:hypothetical protein